MHSIVGRRSVLFVAVALIAAGSARAETHMGQLPSDHVVLESIGTTEEAGGCPSTGIDFQRILPNGTRASGFFRVPARKVLVVTDVDWRYHNTTLEGPGSVQDLRLMIANLADPGDANIVLVETVTLDGNGVGAASSELTSGFVVSSAGRVCPDVSPGNISGSTAVLQLTLRGYLTTDR